MYKYFTAHTGKRSGNVSNHWKEDFQALMDEQFENSTTIQEIDEETFFDSKVYRKVKARIVHVISNETGERVGDDWKNILFKDSTHPVYMGRYYKFDDNYWLTINVDAIKSLTSTIAVRRCNNRLRWVDTEGVYHNIPCFLDRKILENRNYSTAGSSFVLPSGIVEVTTQLNNETNLIQPNQRFLFGNQGNWTAFKVQGGGISNFDNLSTDDNESVGLLKLTLGVDFENVETDNLELGIAEYYQNTYDIDIVSSISGVEGDTLTLNPVVTLNGKTVARNVEWVITDPDVVSITGNTITFIEAGSTNVKCQLEGNPFVFKNITVVVSATPSFTYDIRISPTRNYIFEDETDVFTVNLYENNVITANTFTFTVIPNTVPTGHYIFSSLTGNTFSIRNVKRFLTDTLDVKCVSGLNEKTYKFNLKGDW
jgi:hypothetical protein